MEVLGTSAYDYCHMLDVQKLAECHKNGKHQRFVYFPAWIFLILLIIPIEFQLSKRNFL